MHEHHFCTSEVAALCLALAGDVHAALVLEAYLDVFSHRYLQAKQSVLPDTEDTVHRRLRDVVQQGLPAAPTAADRWAARANHEEPLVIVDTQAAQLNG